MTSEIREEADFLIWHICNCKSHEMSIFYRKVFADYIEERFGWRYDEISRLIDFIRDPLGQNPEDTGFRCRTLRESIDGILPKVLKINIMSAHEASSFTKNYNFHGYPFSRSHIDMIVRHGFIDSIGLTQRMFLRDGFAKALFSCHPVRDVYLHLQDPSRAVASAGFNAAIWFNWVRDGVAVGTWPQNMVAAPIWDLLTSNEFATDLANHFQFKLYKTEHEARIDLSQACVKWGRRLAGFSDEPEHIG